MLFKFPDPPLSSRNYSEKENAMIQSRTEAHEAEYSEGGEYYEGE